MKLTYTTLACPDWTVEQAVKAADQYGYVAVEWRLADGALIGPDTSPDVLNRIRDVSDKQFIEVACLDTSIQVVQATPDARNKAVEDGKRMIDLAREIGAPYLRFFGGEIPQNMTRDTILAPTAEVLQELANYGNDKNVVVMIETHDAWTNSADILALLNAIEKPLFKVLWDTHHTYRCGEAPEKTMAALGNNVAYAHIKDSRLNAKDPTGWTYCLLGEGDVPLKEICAVLKKGYDGYLSLEWEKKWHPEIAGPEIALPQAAKYLQPLLTE